MKINQKLKALREQKNLSQQQVADALYTAQTTISNIENGKAGLDVTMLLKFANFYNVKPQELLGDNSFVLSPGEKADNGDMNHIPNLNETSKEILQALKEQLAIKDKQIEQLLSIVHNQSVL